MTRINIIDLERLHRTGADGVLVVRLMMAYNDINLAGTCLQYFRQERAGVGKYTWQARGRYFVQLQCGHLDAAIKLVQGVEKRDTLKSYITRCSKETQNAYHHLLDYVKGGPKEDKFKQRITSIRNKVIFHYDPKPVKRALATCPGQLGSRRSTITRSSNAAHGRFDVADDLINAIVTQQLWEVPPSVDSQADVDAIADWCEKICLDFLRFSHGIAGRYLEERAAL